MVAYMKKLLVLGEVAELLFSTRAGHKNHIYARILGLVCHKDASLQYHCKRIMAVIQVILSLFHLK